MFQFGGSRQPDSGPVTILLFNKRFVIFTSRHRNIPERIVHIFPHWLQYAQQNQKRLVFYWPSWPNTLYRICCILSLRGPRQPSSGPITILLFNKRFVIFTSRHSNIPERIVDILPQWMQHVQQRSHGSSPPDIWSPTILLYTLHFRTLWQYRCNT